MLVFEGFQSESSRARFYQDLMVTVASQGDQAGVVKSVDVEGQLLVEFGTFNDNRQLELNTGRTAMLVNPNELQQIVRRAV